MTAANWGLLQCQLWDEAFPSVLPVHRSLLGQLGAITNTGQNSEFLLTAGKPQLGTGPCPGLGFPSRDFSSSLRWWPGCVAAPDLSVARNSLQEQLTPSKPPSPPSVLGNWHCSWWQQPLTLPHWEQKVKNALWLLTQTTNQSAAVPAWGFVWVFWFFFTVSLKRT